ncbi:DUF4339 domain-containing protein [Aquibaculum sediminis]|uniref:DUF4339 domain-containing protein n=1 Tax=Aquibaculum sediminis TaxID=3231907 RepID=UPI003451E688
MRKHGITLSLALAALLSFALPAQAEQRAEWYAAIEGDGQGPFTAEELQVQHLAPDTLVWREGEADWAPLSDFAELQAPARTAAAPPPLPGAASEPPDEREYFLDESGAASAPLTRDDVASRLAEGRASADTLVWFDGMADWAPLRDTPLAALLSAAPPAVAAPEPAGPTAEVAGSDPQALLPGRWQAEMREQFDGMAQPIVLTIFLEFGQGGDYSGNAHSRLDLSAQGMPEPVDLELFLQGRWSARSLDANRIELHTQGSQVVRLPALELEEREEVDERSIFEILDPDTLRDEDGTVLRRM